MSVVPASFRAATAIFLHRMSGEADLMFGLPVSGRLGGARRVPGMVSNVLPLRFSIRLSNSSKGVTLASADDHARILDAIVARDADAAERAMRALIQESKDLLAGFREPVATAPTASVA